MSKKENAAKVLHHHDGKEQTAVSTFVNLNNSTVNKDGQAFYVASFLKQGADQAITTKELVKLTGFRDARSLQKEIERERNHGALILSKSDDGGGYFLPSFGEKGRREIELYIKIVRARAINTLRTLKSARSAMKVLQGQMKIGD